MLDPTRDAAHFAPMTKLPAARAETTEAYLAEAGHELAALCTACGACFAACPMVDHIGLRAADGKSATDGLRRLAMGEAAPAETIAWVGACTKSGLCVAACPEKDAGLDAMLLVRIAKQRALNDTRQLPAKQDPTAFPRVKTYARLQLSDEELAKWM
jgi:Fe-S oxidoreductase